MKRLLGSTAAKLAALFLYLLISAAAVFSSVGFLAMRQDGYYRTKFTFYDSKLCYLLTRDSAADVFSEIYPYLENGEAILSSDTGEEYGFHLPYSVYFSGKTYVVDCFVRSPITAQDDFDSRLQLFDFLRSIRYAVIVLGIVFCILWLLLLLFFAFSAGKKNGAEKTVLLWFDKIPTDLFLLLCLLGMYIAKEFFLGFTFRGNVIRFFLWSLFGLAMIYTLCARVRAGTLLQNMLFTRIGAWLVRLLKASGALIKKTFQRIGTLWKVAVTIGIVSIVNTLFLLFADRGSTGTDLFWIMWNLLLFFASALYFSGFDDVFAGGEKLARGEFEAEIDTRQLFGVIRQHAKSLNRIADSVEKASDEKVRSERLKAELITNVSHDIKTPLTSIITYVELLKEEKIDNPDAVQYIEVLERQSIKLKKLVEDVIEASKAASGNVKVSLKEVELSELLRKCAEEHRERFSANGIGVELETPEEECKVLADPRLMWRIFDNLMKNAYDYAMPGTRAYFRIRLEENAVSLSFKNVSKEKLNIPAEELMERFVRGDSARSRQGSGLGLSIAKSLAQAQGARFTVEIDGDLFCVFMAFDRLKNTTDRT